jgi:penicillin-insensitive murein DD-endopeptidase
VRLILPLILFSGCAATIAVEEPVSMGSPLAGYLARGVPLPAKGEGYVLLRPQEETNFGTPALVGLVERAAAGLAARHPGGAPLVVGDLSNRRGGAHSRHRTHRNGRDVDLFFPMVDDVGRPFGGRPHLHVDRFGSSRERHTRDRLDLPRAWTLVELLVGDPEAEVQWIFCERGVKARLLRYGVAIGADPKVLFRASWMMHQPTGAAPHDDHFHVRVFCAPRERALGCHDGAPHWPWVELKDDTPRASQDDASLVEWIAEGGVG